MKNDQYGRVEISENDAIKALLENKIENLSGVFLDNIDTINQYNQARKQNADNIPELISLPNLDLSIKEFDRLNQNSWFMPENYCPNLIEWLFEQCKTDEEAIRISQELELFISYNMLNVLRYVKYLVDTMRENSIVWGVGRGSSVASYVLYLIGVHKVNSLKYNLDINEFLK